MVSVVHNLNFLVGHQFLLIAGLGTGWARRWNTRRSLSSGIRNPSVLKKRFWDPPRVGVSSGGRVFHCAILCSETHLYSISALVPRLSFRGESSSGIAKCQLFSVFKTSVLRTLWKVSSSISPLMFPDIYCNICTKSAGNLLFVVCRRCCV